MLKYSSSTKHKVVANALRALGYFLAHADIKLISDAIESDESSFGTIMQLDTSGGASEGIFAQMIQRILIKNMRSPTSKVVWNACIAVGRANTNQSLIENRELASQLFFNRETAETLLFIIRSNQNLKAKI
jgi:hypothetical protein